MEDKLFTDLHEGLLVHRLYLMAGTEALGTSPANWKHSLDPIAPPSYGYGKPLLLGLSS
jgi:hypothetical protein